MNAQKTNLKYLLIGNTTNKTVLAEHVVTHDPQTQVEAKQIFEKLCKISDKKYDEQNKIQGARGNYFFTIAYPDIFFIVLADSSYPQRYVFEMINNLINEKVATMLNDRGEITASGRHILKNNIEKYEDLRSISKISEVQEQVDDIRLEMKDNIKIMTKNVENTNVLEEKSLKIKDNALLFKNDAKELKKVTWWQNMKLKIIIAILIIGVILAIVLPIVLKN